MHITVKRGGIFIDRTFFKWDELKFVCGAFLSILYSKSDLIVYVGDGIIKLKNEKYEITIYEFENYEELQWKKAIKVLKYILPARTRIDEIPIPINKTVEVKRAFDGKNIYFWNCKGCNRRATPKHFGSEFICWECYEKQKEQETTTSTST
ncbi:MAG: hypothetical protein ACO2OV_04965 [Thermoproteota archaeon]|jgi:hypothetical protein